MDELSKEAAPRPGEKWGQKGVAPEDLDKSYLEQLRENVFTYHAPKPGQPEKYTELRSEAYVYAKLIVASCPASRERSLAITKLEEAVFWANAAIARNE